MALIAEVIPFNLQMGTGAQTIPHIRYPSLQAKAVVFMSADQFRPGQTFLGFGAYAKGFDDGMTHIGNTFSFSEVLGVCISARAYSAEYSLLAVQSTAQFGGALLELKGYVSSLNVGSITLQIDLNNVGGSYWYAVVIGGTNVSCKVGVYDLASGAGSVNLGFDPVALLWLNTTLSGTGSVAGAANNYGFAAPCHNQQVTWGLAAGPLDSGSLSFQVSGHVKAEMDHTASIGGTPSPTKTVTGYVANGFNLGGSAFTVGFTDWYPGYLAIGGTGVSANLVSLTQPASTGVQNTAIDAVSPQLVFLTSADIASSSVVNANANVSFGVYDGVTQAAVWAGQQDSQPFPYKHHSNWGTGLAFLASTATGAGFSSIASDATAGLSNGNLALSWLVNEGTAREVWALVLADGQGSGVCGTTPTPGTDSVLLKVDTSGGDDAGEEFQAYVKTRAIPPSGSITKLGEIQEPLVTAKPSVAILQVVTYRDFELQSASTTISLAAAASEDHVLRKAEGAAMADASILQFQLGDMAPSPQKWSLDQLHVPVIPEGDN